MDKRGIGYPLQVNDKPSQPPVSFDDDLEGEEIRLHVSRHVMTEGETSEGNSVASSYGIISGLPSDQISDVVMTGMTLMMVVGVVMVKKMMMMVVMLIFDDEVMVDSDDDRNDIDDAVMMTLMMLVGVVMVMRLRYVGSGGNDGGSDGGDDDRVAMVVVVVVKMTMMTGGQARITWPSAFDSESEALTPKKGKPMWEKADKKPYKGKHRNGSTFLTDLAASPRPPSAASDRSDDIFNPRPGKGWQQKHAEFSSDNDTEVNYDRRLDRSSPSLATGRPWTRPLDSASEAGSDDWTQVPKPSLEVDR
ncbi:hypothetical protein QZH41_003712 [Actinostola sp. cb2023]|nr:hypothetical protein QZH41_003712 [Actinostola sp. cb2023]